MKKGAASGRFGSAIFCVPTYGTLKCGALYHITQRLGAKGFELFLSFEQGKKLAVAFFLQFFDWDETKGGGVDAITQSAGSRTVVEDVAEMGITLRAADFGTLHPHTAI